MLIAEHVNYDFVKASTKIGYLYVGTYDAFRYHIFIDTKNNNIYHVFKNNEININLRFGCVGLRNINMMDINITLIGGYFGNKKEIKSPNFLQHTFTLFLNTKSFAFERNK